MSFFEPTNWLTTKIVDRIARNTPDCRDITRLLSESTDRKLSLRQRLSIRLHYTTCECCERYGKQLQLLRKASGAFHEHLHESSTEELPSGSERKSQTQAARRVQISGRDWTSYIRMVSAMAPAISCFRSTLRSILALIGRFDVLAETGKVSKQFVEGFTIYDHHVERRLGPDSGVAGLSTNQGHLAKHFALRQFSEDLVVAKDNGFALGHKVNLVANITCIEDVLTRLEMFAVNSLLMKNPELSDVSWEKNVQNPIHDQSELSVQSLS